MGILKFAQFATIEAKVAPARITRTAMLRDARRHQFDYTPKPGFLYVRSRAISSRTNDNFDTYPADELRQAYRTFVGKPVFVNHNNDDPSRGRGIILDAVLHEHTAPDGSPDTWVEVLMEVDAIRFPRLAQAILDGDIDRTSMGCNVMSSECSYCGKVAVTPDQYCEHISNQKGRRLRRRAATGGVESVLVHEVCRGLSFFENSLLVDEPADPTAFFTGVDDSGLKMGRVAAFKLAATNEYIVLGPNGMPGGAMFELHINGCADTYKAKYQRADKVVIEADSADAAVAVWIDPDMEAQGWHQGDVKVYPCARSGVPVEAKPLAEGVCPGTGQPWVNPTRRLRLPCPVCGKFMSTGRGIVSKHAPYVKKGTKVAKTALGSEWDHGPLEPGPEAATRWEGVATSGQGYQVVVLWPEYADAMAAMLSGVFADPERAEEWAQKCRDLGAIDVSIRPPLMERGEEFLEQHRWTGSKTAIGDTRAECEHCGQTIFQASGWTHQSTGKVECADGQGSAEPAPGSQRTTYDSRKIADYDEVHRAHPIETLRNQTCPVCKTQNSWDGNICTVCGYVLPPKPFRAPDTDVTGRVDPDEGWFDPDAKKAEPFDPVPDRDTATKGQKDQGVHTMAQSIAAAARQRLQANQALAAQRRAGMPPRRAADDTSWASPGVVEGGDGTITGDPVPPAEAPSETTEGAVNIPDATNVDVETVGGTGVEDTAPDATADVTDVGGEVPAPAPMDVVDVEAPVAGATDLDPSAAGDERPNVDNSAESADGTPLNASDWNTASRRAARSEMENIRTAVRDRIFSALRLSKLRIAVGVAEHGDELTLAREIENSRLSNESITNEIKALGLVYSRQRQAQTMPTAPHRRSARRSPSMAGGSTPLQSLGSGGSQDDEALFEP